MTHPLFPDLADELNLLSRVNNDTALERLSRFPLSTVVRLLTFLDFMDLQKPPEKRPQESFRLRVLLCESMDQRLKPTSKEAH